MEPLPTEEPGPPSSREYELAELAIKNGILQLRAEREQALVYIYAIEKELAALVE